MRPRIKYFDIIKFFAVTFVLVCHYSRTLEAYGIQYSWKILPDELFHVYTGTVGSMLFFIISGCVLAYNYKTVDDMKRYYWKRFIGIYPMFWLSFFIFFCLSFYVNRGYDKNVPVYRIIYSILGIDGVVTAFVPTFFTVGEWFLGVIIVLYIIYPWLARAICRFPGFVVISSFLAAIICGYTISVYCHIPMITDFLTGLCLFVYGIYFTSRELKVRVGMFSLSSAILLISALWKISPSFSVAQNIFVGICLFHVLVFLFERIECRVIDWLGKMISRYCYAIFLVHHRVMILMTRRFSHEVFGRIDTGLLFIIEMVATLFLSRVVYDVNQKIIKRKG